MVNALRRRRRTTTAWSSARSLCFLPMARPQCQVPPARDARTMEHKVQGSALYGPILQQHLDECIHSEQRATVVRATAQYALVSDGGRTIYWDFAVREKHELHNACSVWLSIAFIINFTCLRAVECLCVWLQDVTPSQRHCRFASGWLHLDAFPSRSGSSHFGAQMHLPRALADLLPDGVIWTPFYPDLDQAISGA